MGSHFILNFLFPPSPPQASARRYHQLGVALGEQSAPPAGDRPGTRIPTNSVSHSAAAKCKWDTFSIFSTRLSTLEHIVYQQVSSLHRTYLQCTYGRTYTYTIVSYYIKRSVCASCCALATVSNSSLQPGACYCVPTVAL